MRSRVGARATATGIRKNAAENEAASLLQRK